MYHAMHRRRKRRREDEYYGKGQSRLVAVRGRLWGDPNEGVEIPETDEFPWLTNPGPPNPGGDPPSGPRPTRGTNGGTRDNGPRKNPGTQFADDITTFWRNTGWYHTVDEFFKQLHIEGPESEQVVNNDPNVYHGNELSLWNLWNDFSNWENSKGDDTAPIPSEPWGNHPPIYNGPNNPKGVGTPNNQSTSWTGDSYRGVVTNPGSMGRGFGGTSFKNGVSRPNSSASTYAGQVDFDLEDDLQELRTLMQDLIHQGGILGIPSALQQNTPVHEEESPTEWWQDTSNVEHIDTGFNGTPQDGDAANPSESMQDSNTL